MPRTPTIYDVAAEAGVSISTVSLTLNSPGRVSERTRRRVLAAVDALGYVPKPDAVAKARRGVGRVGVIAPHTSYPSVARRLNGVLRAAATRPLEVVLFDHESAAESASPLLSSLPVTGRLDGLIVVSIPLDDAVARRLTAVKLPTVLVDVRHPGFDSVHTDDVAGGRLAAEHLIARGHRRFGFLGEAQTSDRYVSPSRRRLEGTGPRSPPPGTASRTATCGWSGTEPGTSWPRPGTCSPVHTARPRSSPPTTSSPRACCGPPATWASPSPASWP